MLSLSLTLSHFAETTLLEIEDVSVQLLRVRVFDASLSPQGKHRGRSIVLYSLPSCFSFSVLFLFPLWLRLLNLMEYFSLSDSSDSLPHPSVFLFYNQIMSLLVNSIANAQSLPFVTFLLLLSWWWLLPRSCYYSTSFLSSSLSCCGWFPTFPSTKTSLAIAYI